MMKALFDLIERHRPARKEVHNVMGDASDLSFMLDRTPGCHYTEGHEERYRNSERNLSYTTPLEENGHKGAGRHSEPRDSKHCIERHRSAPGAEGDASLLHRVRTGMLLDTIERCGSVGITEPHLPGRSSAMDGDLHDI
jgi:hypothetical protein